MKVLICIDSRNIILFEIKTGMRFMVKIFTKCGQKIHIFTTKINSIIHYMFVLFPIKCHQKKKVSNGINQI